MAKTQSITPTIAEFDDWDETKETEALAESPSRSRCATSSRTTNTGR